MLSDAPPPEALSSALGELPLDKLGPQAQFGFLSEARVIRMAAGLTLGCLPLLQQGSAPHVAAFCHAFCFSCPPPLRMVCLGGRAFSCLADLPFAVTVMGEK